MEKALAAEYHNSPRFIDEIKDKEVLREQEQRKKALKERIANYTRLASSI